MFKKKKVLFLLVVILILVKFLESTDSRMMSLGNPSLFLRDDTNIYTFAAAIHTYSDMVIGEIRQLEQPEEWFIGMNLNYSESVFGVYLNRASLINVEELLRTDKYYHQHSSYEEGDLCLAKKLLLIYGFKNNLAFGFGLSTDGMKTPVSEVYHLDKRADYFELIAGNSTEIFDLGFRIEIARAYVRNELTGEDLDALQWSFSIDGRRFFEISGRDKIVVLTASASYKNSYTDYTAHDGAELSDDFITSVGLEIGAGFQKTFGDRVLLIFALNPVNFSNAKIERPGGFEETQRKLIAPNLIMGLESKLNDWLVARMGARKSYEHYLNEIVNKSTHSNTEFKLNFGLGFSVGNLTIDTVVQKDFLFNGPDFIGGEGKGLASMVSVVFKF